MKYDEEYYRAEERDGFYIKSMMKRYWASSMESLLEIDRICKLHNIKYFAYYGTLLGAVRHKGFIPWDDDLDIAMMRVDYERFIKFARTELRPPFQLFNVKETTRWPLRVINNNVIALDEQFLSDFHYCPYPSGVDIFVLDRLPDSESERDLIKQLHFSINVLSQFYDPNFFDSEETMNIVINESDLATCLEDIVSITNYNFDDGKPISPQLAVLSHNISASYFDIDCNDVAYIQEWARIDEKSMPLADFNNIIYVPFEQIQIPIPGNYENILTQLFGPDYMTPKRISAGHDYPAYKKLELTLLDYLTSTNMPIPTYLTE